MYLKGFAHNERVWVFDREREQYRKQHVDNVAVERERYTFEHEGSPDRSIEEMLSKFEGGAVPAIAKLTSRQDISRDERDLFSGFVALFRTRVPEFEASHIKFVDHVMRAHLKLAFSSSEGVRRLLDRVTPGWDADSDAPSPESLVEFAQDDARYTIESDRTAYLEQMMRTTVALADILFRLNWLVCHAPEGKAFLTSDSPLFLVPPRHQTGPFRGAGFLTPGAAKYFPVSSSILLAMGDEGGGLIHVDVTLEQVRALNLHQARASYGLVLGRDDALLRSVVRASGIEGQRPEPKLKISGPV